jgi:hypothetical protein
MTKRPTPNWFIPILGVILGLLLAAMVILIGLEMVVVLRGPVG